MTDRLGSFVLIPNDSTSESDGRAVIRTGKRRRDRSGPGYLGGRSRTRGSPSHGGAGRDPTTRRHDDETGRIVASPSASTKHIRGTPDSVQSGHGIPGIPAPMPTGTTSSRRTSSTTTSTIPARRITPTVPPAPSHRTAHASRPRRVAKGQIPYPSGQLGQQGSYGLLSGAIRSRYNASTSTRWPS
jgi:hypothetical protein